MQHHSLFSDKSDLYASARPHYPADVFDYLANLCSETQLAWDCGCGSGQAAIDLVTRFGSVYASDVSKEQIANAKQHPRIDYNVTSSECTEILDKSVDLVCVAQALHWFDYATFWPEVTRVLKPGGLFSAFAYKLPSIDSQIDKLIQQQIMEVIEPYWAPQNQLIADDYRDITFPFKKIDAPKFHMQTNWNLDELFAVIHTFSATRRCMDKLGDAFFKQAYLATKEKWGNQQTKRKIDFDFVFYVGINE